MKKIIRSNWQAIIEGANLFGTGGGGTVKGAKNILQKITKPVWLVSMRELVDNQLLCTVFGVGGKQNCDPILSSRIAMKQFQKVLGKKIDAIIPVENGPMAIASGMFMASALELPLLDSDIVGMRSSPEIYLETISISNLKRTPCVISNGKKTRFITENLSLEKLENTFRTFAIKGGGDAVVAGYPLLVKDIKNILPRNSVSLAQENGELLQRLKKKNISPPQFCKLSKWQIIGSGKIIKQEKDTTKGFSQGRYTIINKQDVFEVLFKNENLVVEKNGKVMLTCPDSISLINGMTWQALNNFNENNNQEVIILGRKALAIWRTQKGRELFSPKRLGINMKQKLLQ